MRVAGDGLARATEGPERDGDGMALTPGQIAEFKREGFLILPEFIPSDLLQTWRDTFWQVRIRSIDATHAAGLCTFGMP